MADDDIVFESTTDTPEQIADGLGVEIAATADTDTPEGNDPVEGDAPAPVVEETPAVEEPVKRTTRPQRKTVDAVAAAARRSATARAKVLEDENAALRERLREIAAGAPAPREDRATPAPASARPVATEPIKPSDIPDSHPAIQAVQAELARLGPRPKQEDFPDFDAYEEAKETHIEERARLRAKMDYVRQDVATQATIARDSANREQQAINDGFAKTVADARLRHEDYDDVMAEATDAGLRIGLAVGDTLRQSPIGAEVLYYLAQHPTEIDRINALSPYRALAEVGMLEGRIAAALRPLPGQRTTPVRPATRVTRAPDPQQTYLGDGPGGGRGRDINDPNLSLAEYNRLRDEMDVASGRRTH